MLDVLEGRDICVQCKEYLCLPAELDCSHRAFPKRSNPFQDIEEGLPALAAAAEFEANK